jgi:alpha-L-rhamnosidase
MKVAKATTAAERKRPVALQRLLLAAVAALAAAFGGGTASALGFDEARPVWPEGETATLNSFFVFRCGFDAAQGDDVRLRATAGYIYKARLNGAFAAFGPARATSGLFRVDEWRLKAEAGWNELEIDVAGYNCPNFYLAKQTPFLQAEVLVNGKVVAATGGDGFCALTTGKLRKTPRYAYQRPYSESYRLPAAAVRALPLVVQEAKRLLPREWDYPKFDVVEASPISREVTRRAEAKLSVPRFIEGGLGDFVCFPVAELEDNPYFDIQRWKTVSRTAIVASHDGRYALDDGEGAVFALDHVRGGFPGLSVRAEAPTTIYLTYDEILQDDGSVDFLRTDTVATLAWHLDAPGDYALESFEPYGCKYMRVLSVGGRATVSAPYMRTYESPSAARAEFRSSDPALGRIFEAAKASYAANAVDCLTDCPNRERGGWLGDTFFTGRASQWLTGTGRNEKLFLENFSHAERFPSPKRYEGLVPAIWPCDLMCRECFIPTYDMWLIGELGECVSRNGYADLAESFKPKVDGILEYLGRYVNDYGLLQHLPGWVFIEWSDANTLVYDVNYPANMLYAWSLDAAAKLYGRPGLADDAEKIRERVRRESFDGKWFCDNAVVKDRVGFLGPSGRCTEVCQYFAFFTRTATPESHPELYRRLLDEFGPGRAAKGLYPEVAEANFLFGTLLRMEILSRAGRSRQMYDELRDYFLYMADRTGTLWENQQPSASCCHGFAAIASEYLFRDMLGARRIDYAGRRMLIEPPTDMPLDWCEGVVPLSEDSVAEISWRRGKDGKISTDSKLPYGWSAMSEGDL